MTDAERALWKQTAEDYKHALAIAVQAWDAESGEKTESQTIQAAAATVLIHITKLRQDTPRSAASATEAVPGFGSGPQAVASRARAEAAAAQSVAVPACPQCNGDMWDNRGKKKNPKGPDFSCKDKTCVDAKGYKTGLWERDLKKTAVAAGIRNDIDSFSDMPQALNDEADSLPF